MKISHADHEKANEISCREVFKRFSVQTLRLMLPFFLCFLHSKTEKNPSKSGILEMLPSWYILSLKPKGKGDCKNLIHICSVSCLFIFFNLIDEFGSDIIFSTGWISILLGK